MLAVIVQRVPALDQQARANIQQLGENIQPVRANIQQLGKYIQQVRAKDQRVPEDRSAGASA